MSSPTPLQDLDHKIDIIDHVNQDHPEELFAIAHHHYQQGAEISSAKILDIFKEGIQINVTFGSDTDAKEMFIPFEIEGDLEENILYLAYAAVIKQGRDFSGTGKRFFEVINKQKITPNMIRLTVKCTTPLPEYYPGYAHAFVLKSLTKRPNEDTKKTNKKHWSKNLFDRIFIWLMKNLSSKNRQKLLNNSNKDIRLYTLRKSWKSDDSTWIDHGHIDIFTHDDTAGSQWANKLEVGNIILSRSESKDKHPHLVTGQALLIADETAYPALAGILEQWQNPLPPYVILISAAEEEQDYFTGEMMPHDSQVHRVVCSAEKQADDVLAILRQIEKIDVVWAAFESDSAKKVRHFLRNERQVMGKNNHTKAYWNLKSKRSAK
ncbi:siderophore-interacting protein [Marinomonas transparens]|uniref:SIP domain-containing protein n=1 Tax=Marinomonas transparens TaxID=2795388 RepID=A0A934JTM0_9GAMM|nr:siderophore-interacting protein [Marinomonas transparens]MBJ7538097.1 SIP domain-containing protein [Marinomonas transparens]